MMLFDKVRHNSCFAQPDAKYGTQFKNTSNGGYILVYVMVVVLTLCILAASICTSAVRNLKVQQHSIEHMKFVYEAEGIGERFVAELQRAMESAEETCLKSIDEPEPDKKHEAAFKSILIKAIDTAVINALPNPNPNSDEIKLLNSVGNEIRPENLVESLNYGGSIGTLTMRLCIVAGDSELDTEIQWKMSIAMEKTLNDDNTLKSCRYYIDDMDSPVYTSYEIKAVDTMH